MLNLLKLRRRIENEEALKEKPNKAFYITLIDLIIRLDWLVLCNIALSFLQMILSFCL